MSYHTMITSTALWYTLVRKVSLVSCFGMEGVDMAVEGAYDSVDELPEWIQRKLAVLTMLKVKPPMQAVVRCGAAYR